MTVLVLGGNGRLGRALQRWPTSGAHDLRYTRSTAASSSQLPIVDVADRQSLRSAFEAVRPTAVLHLASITGAAADVDPARTELVNVDSVAATVELAEEFGAARVVFVSSSSVYGDRYREPAREDQPLDPRSRYAETKARAELLLATAAASGGPQAVVLRLFNVFGEAFESSLVMRLLRSTPDEPVTLSAMDEFVRDYVHVDDVVPVILRSLSEPMPAQTTALNVGSGSATSTRELVAELSAMRAVWFRDVEGDPSYSCADVTRARELLGLVIEHPLRRE